MRGFALVAGLLLLAGGGSSAAQPASAITGCFNPTAALSPDGKIVVVDCARKGFWRLDPGGGAAQPLTAEPGSVEAFAFADDGRRLLVAREVDDHKHRLEFYDLERGERLWSVAAAGEVDALRVPGRGERLVVYLDAGVGVRVQILDGASGRAVRELRAARSDEATNMLSPDGKVAVLGDGDAGAVTAYDVESGRPIWQASVRNLTGHGTEFAQGGAVVLAYAVDGLKKLDPATGAPVGEIAVGGEFPYGVRLSRDGAAVLLQSDGIVRRVRVSDGEELQRISGLADLHWFDAEPDLIVAFGSRRLSVAAAGGAIRTEPASIASDIELGGGRVLITGSESVRLLDARSGAALGCWGRRADSCAFETVQARFDAAQRLALAKVSLAEVYAASGDPGRAQTEADEALDTAGQFETVFDRAVKLEVMQRRASLLARIGRVEAARAANLFTLEGLRADQKASPLLIAQPLSALADLEAGADRATQAASYLQQATDVALAYIDGGGVEAAGFRTRRALLLAGALDQPAEAAAELRLAVRGLGKSGADLREREIFRDVVRAYWLISEAGAPTVGAPTMVAGPPIAPAPGPTVRHHGDVMAAAFSPDGRHVASADRTGRVILWDTASRALVWFSDKGAENIDNLSWASTGDAFLSAANPLQRWLATGGEPETVAKEGWPYSAYAGAGGTWVQGGERGFSIRDAAGEEVVRVPASDPSAAALSPGGERLAVFDSDAIGSGDGELCVYAVPGGRRLRCAKVKNFDLPVYSADGARLFSVWPSAIEVRDAESLRLIASYPINAGIPTKLSVSRDGRSLLLASDDRIGRVFDAQTGALKLRLEGHLDVVESVESSPDGKTLVTASKDSSVRLWDATTGAPMAILGGDAPPAAHKGLVTIVAYSPDGARIVTGADDHAVKIWNAADGALLATVEAPYEVEVLQVSPDSRTLFVGAAAFGGMAVSMATGETLWSFKEPAYGLAPIPGGGLVVVGTGGIVEEGAFAVFSPEGAVLARQALEFRAEAAAVSPDGRLALIGGDDQAFLFDLAARKVACRLEVEAATKDSEYRTDLSEARFVDGGARVITLGGQFAIWRSDNCKLDAIWDDWGKAPPERQAQVIGGATAALQPMHEGERAEIMRTAPTGAYVAAAWGDGTVELLDPVDGHTRVSLPKLAVNNMIFSPDGARLLVAAESDVLMFDPRDGRYLGALGK